MIYPVLTKNLAFSAHALSSRFQSSSKVLYLGILCCLAMTIFIAEGFAQASGTGRYPNMPTINQPQVNDFDPSRINRRGIYGQRQPETIPSLSGDGAEQNNVQTQLTTQADRQEEKRIGVGINCSFDSDATSCGDNLEALLSGTFNGQKKSNNIQFDFGFDASVGFGITGNNSVSSSSVDGSISALYAASPRDQLQIFSNISHSTDKTTEPSDNTVFDSEETLLFGLGVGYERDINAINIHTRATYGSSAGAEDVTSLSLAGIARNNAGSYNEFVGAIGASGDLSKTESVYAEIGYNRRFFNRTGTRGKEDSSGWTGSIGAIARLKGGTTLQAEFGYRLQETESKVSVSGWTAAANFEKQLSQKTSYSLYVASDMEESEDLTTQGARITTLGSNIDYAISRKSRLIFGGALNFSADNSDSTVDQTLDLTLGYQHRLKRNIDFNADAGWSQAITDAGETTEAATNEFTLSTGIDWTF